MYGEGKSYEQDKDTFVCLNCSVPDYHQKTDTFSLVVSHIVLKIWLLERQGVWQHARKMYIGLSIPIERG